MGGESGGEGKEKWERRLEKATFLFVFNGDCPSCLFPHADGMQGLKSTVLKLTMCTWSWRVLHIEPFSVFFHILEKQLFLTQFSACGALVPSKTYLIRITYLISSLRFSPLVFASSKNCVREENVTLIPLIPCARVCQSHACSEMTRTNLVLKSVQNRKTLSKSKL